MALRTGRGLPVCLYRSAVEFYYRRAVTCSFYTDYVLLNRLSAGCHSVNCDGLHVLAIASAGLLPIAAGIRKRRISLFIV